MNYLFFVEQPLDKIVYKPTKSFILNTSNWNIMKKEFYIHPDLSYKLIMMIFYKIELQFDELFTFCRATSGQNAL